MSIQDLLVALRQAFTGGDATGRLVLFAAFLVVVIAAALVVLWLFQMRSPSSRIEALLDARASENTTSRWPMRIGVLAFVAAVVLVVNVYSAQPSQCAQCHKGAGYAKALAKSAHKDVSCMSCHRQGGPIAGQVSQLARYGRWVLVYTSSKQAPEPGPGSVGDAACLRCHGDVTRGVSSANGIRVRHSDFISGGAKCRDCHNSTAHEVAEGTEPSMDKCLPCHDGKTASAECATCHEDGVIEVRKDARGMAKANVDTGNCYGCHQEKPCLRCHGVTMPHPADWLPDKSTPGFSGTHARQAFANRDLCWRCHDAEGKPFAANPKACAQCHPRPFGKMHGGKAWVAEHGPQATGKKPGAASECYMCHGTNLCELCHPKSYSDRYAPVGGNDDYRRDGDMPFDPDYYEW